MLPLRRKSMGFELGLQFPVTELLQGGTIRRVYGHCWDNQHLPKLFPTLGFRSIANISVGSNRTLFNPGYASINNLSKHV